MYHDTNINDGIKECYIIHTFFLYTSFCIAEINNHRCVENK
jgi:hypothetical protein